MADVDANTQEVNPTEIPEAASPLHAGTGQQVRFGAGPLAGIEGVIIDRYESGQCLVQLAQGVYIETHLAALTVKP